MTGARPSDNSSIISNRGVRRKLIPNASICCCPPDRFAAGSSKRLGQGRERLEHGGEPGLERSLVTAVEPPGRVEVLLDGEPREYAVSTGDLHDAVSGDFVRWRVGDVLTVEDDRSLVGLDDTGDGPE